MENLFRLFELALPDGDDVPAELAELAGVFPIIGNIAVEFFLPPVGSCFWSGSALASFVPMPETVVNENHCPVFRQDDVRFPRQIFDVFAEAVAGAMQHGADEDFGLRVLSFDATHVP